MRSTSRGALAAAALLAAACDDGPAGSALAPGDDPAAPARDRAAAGVEPVLLRFRSVEDPAFPPDPAVCAAAPFQANVLLGASLWSEAGRAADGRVVNGAVRRIGAATACARITDPTFPPGLALDFYVRFDLPEGPVTALGACTLVSNDVPRRGLVLAGCHLRVIQPPSGYAGGVATSLSVFNPARLAGFATGSAWTLQLYPGS